jgi:hypothetical protein
MKWNAPSVEPQVGDERDVNDVVAGLVEDEDGLAVGMDGDVFFVFDREFRAIGQAKDEWTERRALGGRFDHFDCHSGSMTAWPSFAKRGRGWPRRLLAVPSQTLSWPCLRSRLACAARLREMRFVSFGSIPHSMNDADVFSLQSARKPCGKILSSFLGGGSRRTPGNKKAASFEAAS